MKSAIVGCIWLLAMSADAFFVPSTTSTSTRQTSSSLLPWSQLNAKKAKGFGTQSSTQPKKKSSETPAVQSPAPVVESSSADNIPNPFTEPAPQDLSQGKIALERMRREQAEKRNEELRKVKEVKDIDAMLRESPEAAAIPEKVAQRMGKRMLPFVGVPLFGGMAAFVGFWYMATYRNVEFEPALVAASTIAILVVGLVVSRGRALAVVVSHW